MDVVPSQDSLAVESQQPPAKRPRVETATLDTISQYWAWDLYYPNDPLTPQDPRKDLIAVFTTYFDEGHGNLLDQLEDIDQKGCVVLDYAKLVDTLPVPNFEQLLSDHGEEMLACLGVAIFECLYEGKTPDPPPQYRINVRIVNHSPLTALKSIKANLVGRYITVSGNVTRVSMAAPLVLRMLFECGKCGVKMMCHFEDGKCQQPTTCDTSRCRSKTFKPVRSSAVTIDSQRIRLQEIVGGDLREIGRVPRTLDCELIGDIVGVCTPGEVVTLSGVVKMVGTDDQRANQDNKSLFVLYIEANSIRAAGSEHAGGPAADLQFSTRDMYGIQHVAKEPNLLQLIVGSLCPAIYGHDLVKLAMLLGLFGGTRRDPGAAQDRGALAIRADPHILVVGDPGLGKSQLLQATNALSPRGVYVCGNTTTLAGLTVTLAKDANTGDWALEAGALVLSDQGCCCIDEFDKMGNEHQALLEAMEQQSISVAKAGLVCSLPARTSVVAAANPVGGNYNRAKTVSENLKMSSALLSRFDLIFILLDNPDQEVDAMLSKHVMAIHAGEDATAASTQSTLEAFGFRSALQERNSADMARSLPTPGSSRQLIGDASLRERLKIRNRHEFEPVPRSLLRKYIAYARKYVNPTLTSAAKRVLQDFYMTLRQAHHTQDLTPITTRQLEALIRLAEARAKIELREDVTEQDALDVVELYKASMVDTLADDRGQLDFARSSGMSKKKQVTKFLSAVQKVANDTCCATFNTKELQTIGQNIGLRVGDFNDFIDSLNAQNFFLKKGRNLWKLQIADSFSQQRRGNWRTSRG